ncbi:hypothetical protein MICCA_590012 [Microcystis aeruginosa PCC 9432]|jgi:hypothetical protein|uniref:Twitching mobility domain protein n=3 Tax=Microcystis aeruginosa TaxID=1126 RepID=L7EA02_MICAE|nr:hypothetical protein [Microcystis aeruginosa]ELP55859.1 Twitching mobility domain protein [Microcystis aeruginosa TAIHU98]ODV36770.1 hypothetical protein BFG60_3833 [Microcystis aeruginosa NIES-98]GCE61256.1 hypothetical protein MiAbB_03190 [Microcystis aeruginosa NIES-4285]CCH94983.1 hypothetical protein MICCA_590012 [Microcystis aeruginosa PCC 9432]
MLVQSGNSKGKTPIYHESKSQFFLAITAAAAGSLHPDTSLGVNQGNQTRDKSRNEPKGGDAVQKSA